LSQAAGVVGLLTQRACCVSASSRRSPVTLGELLPQPAAPGAGLGWLRDRCAVRSARLVNAAQRQAVRGCRSMKTSAMPPRRCFTQAAFHRMSATLIPTARRSHSPSRAVPHPRLHRASADRDRSQQPLATEK
jgi:hypothetical protein